MGRGPVVQARKEAVNSVKGKVFGFHAKLIAIAAQKGGNPEENTSLAAAIHKAKKEGVPNDTIERAIKKGTGEDKTGEKLVEILYEGYAPGGVALMVSVITDNKNRAASNIRHIFNKYGGNLGESGVVSWMFHKKGILFISLSEHSYESIEELVFETSAENIETEEGFIKITTHVENFHEVEGYLRGKDIKIYESKIDYIPENDTHITEFEKALKFTKMMEAFDEDEDINFVSSNEIISEVLQKEVNDFIEKNTFKT